MENIYQISVSGSEAKTCFSKLTNWEQATNNFSLATSNGHQLELIYSNEVTWAYLDQKKAERQNWAWRECHRPNTSEQNEFI